MMNNRNYMRIEKILIVLSLVFGVFIPTGTFAATLRISPDTGVYTAQGTFTASVILNTQGKPVNAADAQLTFNPKELSVVGVNRGGSVFSLWTQEPTFSNSAGTVSFGGGSPSGYTGQSGVIMSITFRALAAGTPKVSFKEGSVLAADGLGTNVLTAMNGASYTVQAKTDTPAPEYVPPPSTPGAPKVTSETHPSESSWYKATTAKLSWSVPSDVTAVRTLLDDSPSTVPTRVFEEAITSRELTDLPQGTSFFHIQLKNADGWGRVTHFKINVDTEPPSEFQIREEDALGTNPIRTLIFESKDASPVTKYSIQLDGGEPVSYTDTEGTRMYKTEALAPGRHTVVVEAFDSAGNSSVASYSFEVSTFEAPIFTEYAERVNSGVIPALRGTTRPDAVVTVTVREGDREFGTYTVTATGEGLFTFIPDGVLPVGVYTIEAVAVDTFGAQSEPSTPIKMIVEEAGFIAIGSLMVRVLSVIMPLIEEVADAGNA
jgi:Cohesin domain/Bacterial Ig-like domain